MYYRNKDRLLLQVSKAIWYLKKLFHFQLNFIRHTQTSCNPVDLLQLPMYPTWVHPCCALWEQRGFTQDPLERKLLQNHWRCTMCRTSPQSAQVISPHVRSTCFPITLCYLLWHFTIKPRLWAWWGRALSLTSCIFKSPSKVSHLWNLSFSST